MSDKTTCHGCGAPFCRSGCEYCGRGQAEYGGEMVHIEWAGGMVFQNPISSIRMTVTEDAQEPSYASRWRSGMSKPSSRPTGDMGGLPLPVWAAIFG